MENRPNKQKMKVIVIYMLLWRNNNENMNHDSTVYVCNIYIYALSKPVHECLGMGNTGIRELT